METMTLEELRETCAKCGYTQSVEALDAAIHERDELRRMSDMWEMRYGRVAEELNALEDDVGEVAERADKAESELAALKKRVADAPAAAIEFSITSGWWVDAGKGPRIPQSLNGKRVRLVQVEADDV